MVEAIERYGHKIKYSMEIPAPMGHLVGQQRGYLIVARAQVEEASRNEDAIVE